MSLKEKVDAAIKEAMKQKKEGALRALRAIKAAILLAETAEGRSPGPLTEQEEMKLLTKQVKQRKDSIEQFEKNNRPDLAALEREELEVIEAFLPKPLSVEEIENEIKLIITEIGSSSIKDMGKIMKIASEKLAGRAENKLISEVVKKLLS
ncbi:MAG: GatB/YqeY domain-containing protein [Bacteroidia bacterium]|nr:GatB/YqeY domain-containing protein [Bacteroidia bacterium]MDW8158886.1 GatB/YqeY domain-containing protein [Bacteroidia bacterium]